LLDNAIVAWLESLGERDLDEPLRALLRAQGFTDVHFVHGASEFGRDLIAKRVDEEVLCQYAIQSKAGDLGIAPFREVRLQIDSIRTGGLSHPGFDPDLPRVGVLTTTGRLIGDARLEAQTYKQQYASEMEFDVWDQDRLVEMLVTQPQAALAGREEGALLRMLGMADARELTDLEVERFSRRWIPDDGQLASPADVIEAAVLMAKLRTCDRIDLACATALALVRGSVAGACAAGRSDEEALATATSATGLFVSYSEQLFERCDEEMLGPVPFVNRHQEFGFFATYSVRCARTIEILGLLALWQRMTPEQDAGPVTEWLCRFIAEQPGAAHPLSDRYATSLIPAAIVVGRHDPELAARWLREAVVWLANRYDDERLGLSAYDADPPAEIGYLLSGWPHSVLPRRHQSYLASVLLDLISALELGELYNDTRHELLAVNAHPELLHVPDTVAQFRYDGENIELEVDPPYEERWTPREGWMTAPHHDETGPRWLERAGYAWMALACASVLRDRHDIGLVRRLLRDA
jgi:hypothetical protein